MMVQIHVAVMGVKNLRASLARASRRLPGEMERKTLQAAEVVRGRSMRLIRGSRTRSKFQIKDGRRVRRKPPRSVTAKANETGIFEGRLRASLATIVGRVGRKVTAKIGSNLVYAQVQEDRRPFLGRAIQETKEQVFRLIGRAFRVVR